MGNNTDILGNQNIVIQGTTESTITINVNGEVQQIHNELATLKALLEKNQTQSFQTAQNIYNIGQITEANFGFVTGKKAFNELLTKALINALKTYSVPAARFLERATETKQDWETQAIYSDRAKDIIAYSFVGILGIQLRKLMAIGKEDLSETKQRKYIDNCLVTAKRTLQLLCFTLISEVWNRKKEKPYEFTKEQNEALRLFFEDGLEMDIDGYLRLLNHLFGIYNNHKLNFPLSELTDFEENLKAESAFVKACSGLQTINVKLDRALFSMLDCFEAETQLTTVLVNLIFLANYKMVSIKNIGYDEMRNSPPRYLHYYAALGMDSKFNINSERVNYADDPISTDAILLYKGRYQESVNLFPFIIDYNALTFEGGTKICFYSCRDIQDGSLNYCFLEDNGIENIVFSNTLKPDTVINELMMDKEKRKLLKLDTVFKQFQEAKKIILGNDEKEEFIDLFEGGKDF